MTTGALSQNVGKLFSELKLVTDNLLSTHAAANWEATKMFTTRYMRGDDWDLSAPDDNWSIQSKQSYCPNSS